jgi:hypothetical protein
MGGAEISPNRKQCGPTRARAAFRDRERTRVLEMEYQNFDLLENLSHSRWWPGVLSKVAGGSSTKAVHTNVGVKSTQNAGDARMEHRSVSSCRLISFLVGIEGTIAATALRQFGLTLAYTGLQRARGNSIMISEAHSKGWCEVKVMGMRRHALMACCILFMLAMNRYSMPRARSRARVSTTRQIGFSRLQPAVIRYLWGVVASTTRCSI